MEQVSQTTSHLSAEHKPPKNLARSMSLTNSASNESLMPHTTNCDDSLPQVPTSNYPIIHKLLNMFNYEFKTHQIYNTRPSSSTSSSTTKTNTINSVYTTLSLPLTLSRARPLSSGHVRSNSPPAGQSL